MLIYLVLVLFMQKRGRTEVDSGCTLSDNETIMTKLIINAFCCGIFLAAPTRYTLVL